MNEHYDTMSAGNEPTPPPLSVEDFLGEQDLTPIYSNEPFTIDDLTATEPVSSAEEELALAFALGVEEDIQAATAKARLIAQASFTAASLELILNDSDHVLDEMEALDADYDRIISNHSVDGVNHGLTENAGDKTADPDDHPFAIPQTKKTERKGPGLF